MIGTLHGLTDKGLFKWVVLLLAIILLWQYSRNGRYAMIHDPRGGYDSAYVFDTRTGDVKLAPHIGRLRQERGDK